MENRQKNNMSLFSRISFVNLYSNDQERLVAFYRDVLGMVPVEPIEDNDDHWFGFFVSSGLTFAIEPMTNRANYADLDYRKENPVLIQFAAADRAQFEAMTARLKEKSVPIVNEAREMNYGTITNFLDPDGNLLEILLSKAA